MGQKYFIKEYLNNTKAFTQPPMLLSQEFPGNILMSNQQELRLVKSGS